jgi:hypothetical protein
VSLLLGLNTIPRRPFPTGMVPITVLVVLSITDTVSELISDTNTLPLLASYAIPTGPWPTLIVSVTLFVWPSITYTVLGIFESELGHKVVSNKIDSNRYWK